ncbi:MAG: hypothetical protein D6E12_03530 [Desulfovibrio sp.]|nr:MAG: hypothetical protein D6E12_03530 [Desulfovibrio sp.]
MPQGSDFHQRMMFKAQEERLSLEKQAQEIDELRGRVRALEELVCVMSSKLGIEGEDRWKHGKVCKASFPK